VAYVRTVRTSSGATAVQIVWSSRRGSRSIEHLGSAHYEAELAALKAAAAERLSARQAVLDLGVAGPPGSEPLPITSSQMTHLWDGLCSAYRVLGFETVTKGDNVFRDLVLARIIEPTSKIDAARVLGEVGVQAASYATLKRRLPGYARPSWRQSLAAASARHAGLEPASLVLFDVSTRALATSVLRQESVEDMTRGGRESRRRSWSRRRVAGFHSRWRSIRECPSPGPELIGGRRGAASCRSTARTSARPG